MTTTAERNVINWAKAVAHHGNAHRLKMLRLAVKRLRDEERAATMAASEREWSAHQAAFDQGLDLEDPEIWEVDEPSGGPPCDSDR